MTQLNRNVKRLFSAGFIAVLCCTLVFAEKYVVKVSPAELSSEQVEEFLKSFEGRIDKLKAKNSKGKAKTTEALEVQGDADEANLIWGLCKNEWAVIRRFGPPYGAIVMVLAEISARPSKGDVRKWASSCLQERVPSIADVPEIRVSDTELFNNGMEIGWLYVVQFDPGSWRNTYADTPRKMGP